MFSAGIRKTTTTVLQGEMLPALLLRYDFMDVIM